MTDNEFISVLPAIESMYPEFAPYSASNETESTEEVLPYYGTRMLYWYHPDYVSNVDLVTDISGQAYELFLYNEPEAAQSQTQP